MKCIDLHSHVIPTSIIDAIRAEPHVYARDKTAIEGEGRAVKLVRGKKKFELDPENYDVEAKLESMDRKRISVAAISPAPLVFFYNLDADQALKAARAVNDGIAQMVGARPDRLRGMATLPMQYPEAAIAELERVVREYGFKAVELGTGVGEEELADPKFRPVLRRIAELKIFIFAHSNVTIANQRLDCYYLSNLIGNPLETTIMAAKLMLSGALDELPELKILLSHGGGFLPYQIGRLDHGHTVRPETAAQSKSKPLQLLKRFYFDALNHNPDALRYLLNIVGSERVVIGTDSPYDMGEEHPLEQLDAVPGLTQSERENVCYRTALRLLDEAF